MKTSELIRLVLKGRPVLVAKYLGMEKDSIRRRVPKEGESATMPVCKHKLLVGYESFELAVFLDKGQNLEDQKELYEEGTPIVVQVDALEKTKYGNRMQGTIAGPLEQENE